SLGVMTAQTLLLTNPEARGGILMHGFVPVDQLGLSWRDELPVQMHTMDADPWVVDDGDLDAARETAAAHRNLEVLSYPGSGHLFTDRTDADYDIEATALLLERVSAMLERIDAADRGR
ncbi:MAG: dienelactone hydrolase family protein, partial [Actinobacteria bacterium]|nr:dienelactone hydrolase family protein [Actinomycetota bacterium]